jgi:hypothetical protein
VSSKASAAAIRMRTSWPGSRLACDQPGLHCDGHRFEFSRSFDLAQLTKIFGKVIEAAGDGGVIPVVQPSPQAMLHLVSPRQAEEATLTGSQIAKTSSSNATANRRLTGSSTASS